MVLQDLAKKLGEGYIFTKANFFGFIDEYVNLQNHQMGMFGSMRGLYGFFIGIPVNLVDLVKWYNGGNASHPDRVSMIIRTKEELRAKKIRKYLNDEYGGLEGLNPGDVQLLYLERELPKEKRQGLKKLLIDLNNKIYRSLKSGSPVGIQIDERDSMLIHDINLAVRNLIERHAISAPSDIIFRSSLENALSF